jgi:hypothetical protein
MIIASMKRYERFRIGHLAAYEHYIMHTSLINMFHTGKMMQHHPSSLELYGLAPLLSTFSPLGLRSSLFLLLKFVPVYADQGSIS